MDLTQDALVEPSHSSPLDVLDELIHSDAELDSASRTVSVTAQCKEHWGLVSKSLNSEQCKELGKAFLALSDIL